MAALVGDARTPAQAIFGKIGTEFQVNTYTTGYQQDAAVAQAEGQGICLKGKGSALLMPFPITDATGVTVQFVRNPATLFGSTIECWDATLSAPAVLNDGTKYKDKAP